MSKSVNLGLSAAVLAIAGYYGYNFFYGADLSRYANININLGAVALPDNCSAAVDYSQLLCLTDELKSQISPKLLVELERPYSVADAKKWSNFPPAGYSERIGPTLGDFTAEQRGLIKAILMQVASMTSNEGYDELEQILNADDFLAENTSDQAGFSSSNYHIAFLGTPGELGVWQLYFGGHHFAMSNTYKNGVLIGATPSFRGVEPFTKFSENGRENQPMAQEQAAFAAIFASLTAAELSQATLAGTFTDILAGPQKDDAIPSSYEGLKVDGLAPEQQALVLAAIETYVRDINAAGADVIMAKYRSELPETYIGLSGTPSVNAENDYVRVNGPSVWIEFSMQPGRSLPGIHPHSVWRDKVADYGGYKE
jgi:hypothetical protein